jgi:hypothetical protein
MSFASAHIAVGADETPEMSAKDALLGHLVEGLAMGAIDADDLGP